MSRSVQRIAGIDGCRSGWLVVEACSNLTGAEFRIAPNWNAIASTSEIVAVDMPIGLSRDGVRQCEVAARKIISPHGSRVFKTLPRGALRFPQKDWRNANQWSKDKGYGGISKQIWAIRPKIIEIDRAITPALQSRVYEAHPELAFARLNGAPLESKHTAQGLTARKHLLERAGFRDLDAWLQRLRGTGAKADDLYDACILVLTARNLLQNSAKQVPAIPETDSRGLRMAIAYYFWTGVACNEAPSFNAKAPRVLISFGAAGAIENIELALRAEEDALPLGALASWRETIGRIQRAAACRAHYPFLNSASAVERWACLPLIASLMRAISVSNSVILSSRSSIDSNERSTGAGFFGFRSRSSQAIGQIPSRCANSSRPHFRPQEGNASRANAATNHDCRRRRRRCGGARAAHR